MKKRILIATLLGAVIAFVWGYISWSLLPWHKAKTFQNNSEVARVIQENTDGHAMYILPPQNDDGTQDIEAITQGPFIYATIRPGQLDGWNMAKPMIFNFAVNLLLALIIAIIMVKRSHYLSKLTTGFLFGLFAGITAALPLTIWMELPLMETSARLCDPIIAWTLAAAAMALIIKKTKRRIFTS